MYNSKAFYIQFIILSQIDYKINNLSLLAFSLSACDDYDLEDGVSSTTAITPTPSQKHYQLFTIALFLFVFYKEQFLY